MRRFVALACALSIAAPSPALLAATSAPLESRGNLRNQVPDIDSPPDAGDDLELVRILRSLAVVQVLRPTVSPMTFDLWGSADGLDWGLLGSFQLLDGDVPPADQMPRKVGDPLPLGIVVGTLNLVDGEQVPYVVASIARSPEGSLLPNDSFIFLVYGVSENEQKARARAMVIRSDAVGVRGIDLGDEPALPPNSSRPPRRLTEDIEVGICGQACKSA